jgi:uncharacterized surface protein with fasciclin (FAS1) repeats
MHSLLGTEKPKRPAKPTARMVPAAVDAAYTAYDAARAALAQFKANNKTIVERLYKLETDLEGAAKLVKEAYLENVDAVGNEFEGFTRVARRAVNADELVQLVPEVLPYTDLSMTVETFDALVKKGLIAEPVIAKVVTSSDTIKAPKK